MMGLNGEALKAAQELKESCPGVVFTSGLRSLQEQAEAMAKNVVLDRGWIAKTYVHSYAADMCQQFVERNKKVIDERTLRDAFYAILRTMTASQLLQLSRHLVGQAFDVKPTTDDVKTAMKNITERHGGKFLDHEGALKRWHAQF